MSDSSRDARGPRSDASPDDRYELLLIKYKLLFDHARDMILFVDQSGKILDANQAAVDTYGYTKEELVSLYVFDLRKYDSPELVRKQMKQAGDSSILFETTHKTKDGKTIPVEVSSTGVVFSGERILMSIIRDISAKQEYLSRIKHLAFYDELTGILNRKSFRDALRERIARADRRFALLLIDIDNFKKVNDTCSHCVGDKLLVETAAAIERGLADRGFLFRLGGDEFTILVDEFRDREDLISVIDVIRVAACRTFEIDGCEIDSSFSIGISLFPDNGTDESLLLKRADIAMYRVKEANRNGYAFYDCPEGA